LVLTQGVLSAATLFSDNFDDGNATGWTVQYGTWSVVQDSGSYVYYQSSLNEGRTSAGSQSWTNVSVEARVKVDNFNGSNRAYVCGRYKDGNNYYAASLMSNTIEIRKKVSGSSSTLVSKSYTIATGTWYTVKLVLNGSSITMYINGTQQLTATDSSLTSGAVGLVPYKVVAKYDDVVVSDLTGSSTPTPTIRTNNTPTPTQSATPTPTRRTTPTPTVRTNTPTPTRRVATTPTPTRSNTPTPTQVAVSGAIYVAPNGSVNNPGTIDSPTTLTSAITRVASGGTIYMRGGTYSFSSQLTIARGNNGSSGAQKNIFAYGSEKPVLDFSSQSYGDPSSVTNPRGLQIDGSYWHVKGLEVKGSADNGIFISGNGNTIEMCNIHNNRDSGLQLGRYASTASRSEWPCNNLILNCDSHDNADPDNYEDADGFACKLTTGSGNVFRGCVSYYNCDDGWDLYSKTETGAIDPVTIENCVAYNNGKTSAGLGASGSDGNGFKLGGDKISVNHIARYCIAFNNKKHGFTHNSNPGSITITNCTSWHNSTLNGSQSTSDYNYEFSEGNHMYTNNLSYAGGGSDHLGTGTDVSGSNVWWINGKSSSAKGLVCDSSDFVSLTVTISRNSDGSLNLGNFLKLASGSDLIGAGTNGANIGAR
jgi:hypothetical protein